MIKNNLNESSNKEINHLPNQILMNLKEQKFTYLFIENDWNKSTKISKIIRKQTINPKR